MYVTKDVVMVVVEPDQEIISVQTERDAIVSVDIEEDTMVSIDTIIADEYFGDYIISQVDDVTIVETKNKILTDNITIYGASSPIGDNIIDWK